MKKLFSSLSMFLLIMLFALSANAQLTGTKNIPGDYATLELAINDLNTQGVGAGGVILNLIAGNPQTAPVGGYIVGGAGSLVLTTTSIANQVTIQGNGNTITASNALVAGVLYDGIFKLIGADWITVTNFLMNENPANTVTAAGTNNMTEWGVALLYVTTTDGAQHNTIANCNIDLDRTYQNTFGIYSNSTHAPTTITTTATATTANGGNSYMSLVNTAITDVNNGIVVVGPTGAADMNDSIRIGTTVSTGNLVTNFGTTGTFSGYANVSGTVNGILVRNSKNYTVNYNTITSSNGGVTAGTINGVQVPSYSNAPTGTFSASISNNILSLKSGLIAGAINGINIGATTASATAILNINNNDFNNFGHTVAGTALIQFIFNDGPFNIVNINNNTFSNISVNTTGGVTFIDNDVTKPSTAIVNVNSNSIVGTFAKTGAGGTVRFYNSFATTPATAVETNMNNNFSNVTLTGATTLDGWRSADGSATSPFGPGKKILNNTFTNIVGGTSAITSIMTIGYSNNADTANNIAGNVINSITNGNTIVGILSPAGTQNFFSNTINGLSTTGTSVIGMSFTAGATQNVYKNKIYDLQSNNAGGVAYGISNVTTTPTTFNISNNIIGDLRAPITTSTSDAVRGIHLNIASASTTINVTNNSIYLNAASSGVNFNTSGIFHTANATATSGTLNLRNNVIVNLSTPAGTGTAVAYRRSGTALNNYGTASNYNLFYAGTPGASNLIFSDGTNSDQTLSAYKTRVTPRDAASATENPVFMSTTGSNANFLRPDSTVATFIESGATTIAGITTDYRNLPRYPNAGYPNNPSFPAFAPDMGAYEFGGIWTDILGPTISYTVLGNTGNLGNRQLTVTITDPSGVATGANGPRLYYKKSTDPSYFFDAVPSVAGNNYTFTINSASLGGVNPGDIIQYYVAAQDLIANMSTNPPGGSGINPPGTTPPGVPNSYTVTQPAMSGTYTVGLALFTRVTGKYIRVEERIRTVTKEVAVSQDNASVSKTGIEPVSTSLNAPNTTIQTVTTEERYSVLMEDGHEYNGPVYYELTDAIKQELGLSPDMAGIYATITAAVNDVNLRGVSGHTTLSLTDATYPTETYPIIVNVVAENLPSASARITIKPATGVTSTISGSLASNALIRVQNSYVTIDGSNAIGGTSRDLTITNTSTTGPNVVSFTSTGTTPITNGELKNNIIINGINTSSAIIVSDNTLGNAGYFNNITVQNNSIQKAYVGAYNISVVAPGNGSGLTYMGNELTTTGANQIRFTGIYVQGVDGAVISQNQMANFENLTGEDDRGIWLATGTTNTTVERNNINTLKYTGTGGYGCYGVAVSSATLNCNNVIKNNSIADLSGDGWTHITVLGDNTHGIYIFGTAQTGIDVFYNSINLSGNTLNQTDALSTGICLATGCTAELKNNIIVNNLGLLGATGYGSTGIYLQTGASQLESSDYNDIYANATGSGVKAVGKIGTTNYLTIQTWRTASGTDANSISWDPLYVSLTNLTPQSSAIVGTAWPLASVAIDILGNPRSTSVSTGPTDMGAYEIAFGAGTVSVSTTVTADGTYPLGFGGALFGNIIISGYTGTPFDISWMRFSGQTPPNPPPTTLYGIGYDSVWVSTGTFNAASYTIQISAPKNSLFNITDTNSIIVAKTNNGGANWTAYPGTYVPGYPTGFAQATGLTSFSIFAVTSSVNPLPVELASFTSNVNRNVVKLNWTTTEEQNNSGFDIERKPVSSQTWNKVGNVTGSGNSSQPKNYTFTDNANTGNYNYRLKQIDFNGNFQYFDLSGEVIVGVPADFKLSQNYPNPFNPTTKVDYDLPVDSKVNLRVYDMLGREVASLVNEQVTAGYYTVQLNASNLSSGTYFFRLVAQGTNGKEFVMTKKMQLIK